MSRDTEPFRQTYLAHYREPAQKLSPEEFERTHGEAFLVYFGERSELRAPERAWQATRFEGSRQAGANQAPRSTHTQVFPVKYSGRSMSPRWVTVGRAERSNDIPIVDESISASHAVFERGPAGEFLLRDAASRNGTFVNDEAVDADHPRILESGDAIRFGSVKTVFLLAPEFGQLARSMS